MDVRLWSSNANPHRSSWHLAFGETASHSRFGLQLERWQANDSDNGETLEAGLLQEVAATGCAFAAV